MSAATKPSAYPFESAAGEAAMSDYIRRLVVQAHQHYHQGRALLPEVQAFKEFIEHNPIVFTEFVSMFEGATEPVCSSFCSKIRFLSCLNIPSPF